MANEGVHIEFIPNC